MIVRPEQVWEVDQLIGVSAQAATFSGAGVEATERLFVVEPAASGQEGLWQPIYNIDFDASELDLETEGQERVQLLTEAETDALDAGLTPPLRIAPDQVFASPQRVWIPVPTDVDPYALDLYYYNQGSPRQGWYPAENVIGWLVPGSERLLEVGGGTYYGFVVRHAGVVQLAPSLPEQSHVAEELEAPVMVP